MTKTLFAAALLAATAAAQPASAALIAYDGFASAAGLTLNRDAALATDTAGRSVLRVAPARSNQTGSAFTTAALDLSQGFSTRFTFNVNNNDGGYLGADGLVFTVTGEGATVAGGGGTGMGYAGLSRSLGVEFDSFNSGGVDRNSGNHIGIDTNGDIDSRVIDTNLPFVIDGGSDITAWVDYDPTLWRLDVRYAAGTLAVRPAAAQLSYDVDLAALLGGTAGHVGFTSATGGGYSNHDLVSWSLSNTPGGAAGAVPEPATWALFAAGFGMVGATARRRRRVAAA